jgi:pyrimidine operon attenuation protein/uracil phosphoribosyltransferase
MANPTLVYDARAMAALIGRWADAVRMTIPDSPQRPPALVGIARRGVPLAQRLARLGAGEFAGSIEVRLYTDALEEDPAGPHVGAVDLRGHFRDQTVVIVDDVLYTGRSLAAALPVLLARRPRWIGVAVLIDRGHRVAPIGHTCAAARVWTAADEIVKVSLREVDGEDAIQIVRRNR